MSKKGKIKFADPVKGYGYILADDAQGPHDTTFFRFENLTDAIDRVASGDKVEFDLHQKAGTAAKWATNVSRIQA